MPAGCIQFCGPGPDWAKAGTLNPTVASAPKHAARVRVRRGVGVVLRCFIRACRHRTVVSFTGERGRPFPPSFSMLASVGECIPAAHHNLTKSYDGWPPGTSPYP